jgi:4-hydroxymandelate oxidase
MPPVNDERWAAYYTGVISRGTAMKGTAVLGRRRVLQSILATPVLAGLAPATKAFGQETDAIITAADQALDVFDFAQVARVRLPPAHFGYLATGVDGDATLHANAAGFANYSLRVRRMIGFRDIDMSVDLFGTAWDSPIVLDPVGSQRAFHPEGEVAVARAARSRKHLQILSTVASTSVEDVTAARGAPIW